MAMSSIARSVWRTLLLPQALDSPTKNRVDSAFRDLPTTRSDWSAPSDSPNRFEGRFEYKYPIDLTTYYRLRSALVGLVQPCSYTRSAGERGYLVRSLYYDTFDARAYVEKIIGLPDRIKLRVRAYAAQPEQAGAVRVELKTRRGLIVRKFSTLLSWQGFQRWQRDPDELAGSDPVLIEFRRLTLLQGLAPNVLVDYRRQAFETRDGGDVRITFDRDLRFATAQTLFPSSAFFRPATGPAVLLEIKTANRSPRWLQQILAKLELPSRPHSKYASGVEHTLAARFH